MSSGLVDHMAGSGAPAPRNVPGAPRFAGLRAFATLLVIAGLIVAAVAANRVWTRHRHGNPDPHGVRLSLLRQATAALPAARPDSAEQIQPFHWIPTDCVSMPGNQPGWSNETLLVSAGARNIAAEMQTAKNAMTARGWRLSHASGDAATAQWTKPIPGTTSVVIAALTLQPTGWNIYADAPPAVHPQIGCP